MPNVNQESPPPEPTPSPPPPTPEPARRPVTNERARYDSQGDISMSGTAFNAPLPSPSANQVPVQTPYGQQFAANRPPASPAPLTQPPYSNLNSTSHTAMPQTPLYQPQSSYTGYAATTTPLSQHPNPLANYNQYQATATVPRPAAPAPGSHSSHANAYNPPRPVEVYTLAEAANSSIPADIRAQFHHDEFGKVIFYTAPPLDVNPVPEETQSLGHSLRYLADKARRKEEGEKKRKARDASLEAAATENLKRFKTDEEAKKIWIASQKLNALRKWSVNLDKGTDELYQRLHGENWKEVRDLEAYDLAVRQERAFSLQRDIENHRKQKEADKDGKISSFKWI
jgi:chromatin structure-remodeling complex subunit RSC1/2